MIREHFTLLFQNEAGRLPLANKGNFQASAVLIQIKGSDVLSNHS